MRHLLPASSGSSPIEDEPPAARLFQEHAATIFAYLRLRTATPEEAEDLLLDVFLVAIEQLSMLNERTSQAQRAWLRGVAAHKVADHYRRGQRRPQVTLDEVSETLYADEARSPEGIALHHERDEQLRLLLESLPSLTRQMIHLRFVYGLSCAQIAEALDKREGAVRKQLWRALNQIRELYHNEGGTVRYDSQ
jgi:RNA polymerase sigma-70 factor (ECF subfamily)